MILLFLLACPTQNPSDRDRVFCRDACTRAGAGVEVPSNVGPFDPTQTTVYAGSIYCTCYFPKGEIQP